MNYGEWMREREREEKKLATTVSITGTTSASASLELITMRRETTSSNRLPLLQPVFQLERHEQMRSQRPSSNRPHRCQRQQQQQKMKKKKPWWQKAEQSLAIRGTEMNSSRSTQTRMMMDEFIALENNFINYIILSSGISVGRPTTSSSYSSSSSSIGYQAIVFELAS